jgi:hypothetical protein
LLHQQLAQEQDRLRQLQQLQQEQQTRVQQLTAQEVLAGTVPVTSLTQQATNMNASASVATPQVHNLPTPQYRTLDSTQNTFIRNPQLSGIVSHSQSNTALPSLADLRSMQSINQQADAILYGHPSTAAILGSGQQGQTYTSVQPASNNIPGFTQSRYMQAMGNTMQPQSESLTPPSISKEKFLSPEQFAHRPGFTEIKFEHL